MQAGLVIVLMLAVQTQDLARPDTVSIYFGPIPTAEGFVAINRELEDSYRDLREEYERDATFHERFRVVSDPSEALLLLEITDRGLVDTGMRTGTTVATGPNTAVGNSVPVRTRQLWARLAVRDSSFVLDIDGAAGLRLRTYRNQARNVLQQVVVWLDANREAIDNQDQEARR